MHTSTKISSRSTSFVTSPSGRPTMSRLVDDRYLDSGARCGAGDPGEQLRALGWHSLAQPPGEYSPPPFLVAPIVAQRALPIRCSSRRGFSSSHGPPIKWMEWIRSMELELELSGGLRMGGWIWLSRRGCAVLGRSSGARRSVGSGRRSGTGGSRSHRKSGRGLLTGSGLGSSLWSSAWPRDSSWAPDSGWVWRLR